MNEWSDTAKRLWNGYCVRARAAVAGTGADADEVIEDLRRHVDEEIRKAQLSVVTEEDLRRILARVGEPKAAAQQPRAAEPAEPLKKDSTKQAKGPVRPGFLTLFFGVLLPVITILFELVTGFSAEILFDPIPSWWHVAALALVPVANALMWSAARDGDARHAKLLGWLNGMALGISAYYAILYLPFLPIAAMGLVILLGLIPLTPTILLGVTPAIRRSYRERTQLTRLPGGWRGFALGFALLVLLQLPDALTQYGLTQAATAEDAASRAKGVRLLRVVAGEEALLRACYGAWQREREFDLVRALTVGRQYVEPEAAREVFYRVTGKPFNSVRPPSLRNGRARWNEIDEFEWDSGLGGETVAGRVKGLSLLSSRLDALTEPEGGLVYCEWTMEFKNVSRRQREARAQIALPPGAVVSRLTLWVNGEEREAAFAGRAQVREAYRKVAVVERRDPVLVTTSGPDRVLMQCFPVPAGGVMKVRLGMTAPLQMQSADQGQFLWPRFLERNFRVADEFKHALWLESPMPLTCTDPTATLTQATNKYAVRLGLTEDAQKEAPACVVARCGGAKVGFTRPDAEGLAIRQTLQSVALAAPGRVVFVFDGSVGLKAYTAAIAEGLTGLPAGTEVTALLAENDAFTELLPLEKTSPATMENLKRRLRSARFTGGQDNMPALEAAWDLAATAGNGVVVWVHAPQPVLLSAGDGLRQRFERSAAPPRLLELQVSTGPDRVLEKLDGLPLEHVPRAASLQTNLAELCSQFSGQAARWEMIRERVPSETPAPAHPLSQHVARLWAKDEVRRLLKHRHQDEAIKLAGDFQLVTPVSGAVVLETMAQFTQNGLMPADPTSVPAVPEPATWVVAILGAGLFALKRWKKRLG